VLDRWLLSELHGLVRDVDAALEVFDTQRAGQLLSAFVDDLSNWYVRRSRRRFWAGEPAALATLHECIDVLTRLLAPLVPFVTERVWQDVVRPVTPEAAESVHLASWPAYDESLVDERLAGHMALVRRVVELGRAARAESKVRTRQPLKALVVFGRGWSEVDAELRAEVLEELNVQDEAVLDELVHVIDRSAKPNFRALGKRFGAQTRQVAAAITGAEVATLLGESPSVEVDGASVLLGPDEFTVTETPREGWAVASDAGVTVALDLELTPQLRRAGLAREAVRLVQEARKSSGLDVSDRITLHWQAEGELAEAMREHADTVAEEVLASTYAEGLGGAAGSGAAGPGSPDAAGARRFGDADLGLVFWLTKSP
jgi:isoleucyl-tRNA synthetase